MLSPEEIRKMPPPRTWVTEVLLDMELDEWYRAPTSAKLRHMHPMPNFDGCTMVERILCTIGVLQRRHMMALDFETHDEAEAAKIKKELDRLWGLLPPPGM